MILPTPQMRKERVTLLKYTWGKDSDAGRVILSTSTTNNVACSVEPGTSITSMDETGRWTMENPHTLRFNYDPFLKSHDEVIWIEEADPRSGVAGRTHRFTVLGTSNRMGRGVTYEVNCIERT